MSHLTYGEEKDLVYILKDLMNLETDLENAKADLCIKSDFNLVDCFRIFDYSGRGWCSFEEFREGLSTLGIYPHLPDLELVFVRYDLDRDGNLRYSEFCEMMTPKNPEIAQILNSRSSYYIHKPYYRRDEFFHPETRGYLGEVLRTILSVEV